MAIIRLCYAANLPTPAEALRALGEPADRGGPAGAPSPAGRPVATAPAGEVSAGTTVAAGGPPAGPASGARTGASGAPVARLATSAAAPAIGPAPQPPAPAMPAPASFAAVVALFEQRREPVLAHQLSRDVHPVRCEPGRLEFRPTPTASRDLAPRVAELLSQWTGRRWMVSVSGDAGEPTLAQQRAVAEDAQRAQALAHPLVQAALATFPGATLEAVRSGNEAPADALSPDDSAAGDDGSGPDSYPTDVFDEIPERDD
jgi:DNA polymerase-3 subunit gamma/tau